MSKGDRGLTDARSRNGRNPDLKSDVRGGEEVDGFGTGAFARGPCKPRHFDLK